MNINPNIKKEWNQSHQIKSVNYYFNGIIAQDRYILSEAISLVENKISRFNSVTIELLDRCYNVTSNSWRIGITGSPGVGKSTFIEKMGMYIIEKQSKRIAVLAIDPSSAKTKGSILGDKTRMPILSANNNSFIRPSPSENYLGGVNSATKEAICLCEAAGFDVIIIETVGVGQSETMVADLVDMSALLLLPGAGDEIQGIKRGIVEMADILIVNKSDGERVTLSKQIQKNYQNAIHLFQPKDHGKMVNVLRCSSLEGTGIDRIWNEIEQFFNTINSGFLEENRATQDKKWFDANVLFALERMILKKTHFQNKLELYRDKIKKKELSPYEANALFTQSIFNNLE